MTKGAKIGIGVGIAVALGIASYFLFFKNKGEKNKKKNDEEGDSDEVMEIIWKTPVRYLQKSTKLPNNTWFYFNTNERPKKGKVVKDDTVIISGTDKFDGDYNINQVWIDGDGKVGAVSINLQGKYEVVTPKDSKFDRTFENFGQMVFKRPYSAFAGGCGCGA